MRRADDARERTSGRAEPWGSTRLTEELEFLRVLWLVDHVIQAASRRMYDTLGLTGPQRLALRIISTHAGLAPGDLARILHLHPSTLTGILQRLEARSLAERRVDRSDRRRVRLFVTRRGAALVASLAGTLEHAVKCTLVRWTRKDVHRVKALLTDLAAQVTDPVHRRRASTVQSALGRR